MNPAMIEWTGTPEKPMQLRTVPPLFRGHQRLVFQHPDHPDLLIKIIRSEYAEAKFGPKGPFHHRRRRCLHYQVYLRELKEYLVACARSAELLPFLQETIGLVHTDLGLGIVVRKVCGPDGKPATCLSEIAEKGGLNEVRWRLLDRFLDSLQGSDIVVDDFNAYNIVLGVDPSGAERFVLIDGLGSSTLVPLKAWSRWLNHRSKRSRIALVRADVEEKARKAASGS